ncbi:hypothetical protein SAMN05192549_11442 [Duganella sacchari]|uniref:Uncharacterized protein n=2 Tax=Duganella sacchari TaxID=551987 RepID=A0A1M7R822_9BURK|nr:hypothetical protein SAMN05192549_11442 [Duganella sacchari]
MAAVLLVSLASAHAAEPTALKGLGDAELRNVNVPAAPVATAARTRYVPARLPFLPNWLSGRGAGSGTVEDGHSVLFPLLGLITADVSTKDVYFGSNPQSFSMNADGSISVPLPQTVGELDLQNLRVSPGDTNNFGGVQIRGIDLSRTVINISPTR